MQDDYDLQERAAIRELDGGQSQDKAELFAQEDIKNRETKKSLNDLRTERDEFGIKVRAETDKARKDELFKQWMDLNTKILELEKELKNGRRISQ